MRIDSTTLRLEDTNRLERRLRSRATLTPTWSPKKITITGDVGLNVILDFKDREKINQLAAEGGAQIGTKRACGAFLVQFEYQPKVAKALENIRKADCRLRRREFEILGAVLAFAAF